MAFNQGINRMLLFACHAVLLRCESTAVLTADCEPLWQLPYIQEWRQSECVHDWWMHTEQRMPKPNQLDQHLPSQAAMSKLMHINVNTRYITGSS